MDPRDTALVLIESIYAAAVEPDRWNDVALGMSEAFGEAAVLISVELVEHPLGGCSYRAGLAVELVRVFAELWSRGLPWDAGLEKTRGRFTLMSEFFPDALVPETEFYQRWMQPQRLAPVAPMLTVFAWEGARQLAALAVYRRADATAGFGERDLALGNLLVPHLMRAYAIHAHLGEGRSERAALADVVDRLRVGVILLDIAGRVVLANPSASRILALRDGLCLDGDRLRTSAPGEAAQLQELIDRALQGAAEAPSTLGGAMSVSRPSGRRAFPVVIGTLLRRPPEAGLHGAVAVVFVADPETRAMTTADVLQALHGLTPAEAELTELLSMGLSLEEAARRRGVTLNTARGQLKQVFSKTRTRRQGELMRLILTGIPLGRGEEDEEPDGRGEA